MKKIIGIVLILGSIGLVYFGIKNIRKSTASVEILGADLSVSNEEGKMEGYIYLGLGVAAFVAGVY